MSFFGATGTPVFGFLVTSPLGFKGVILFKNVFYSFSKDVASIVFFPTHNN